MKIVSVEPIPLAYRDPNRPHPDPRQREAAYILLVRITTDEGVIGWGETWTRFAEANRAVSEVVRGLDDVLIGADPLQPEALYETLARRMYWYGEGGLAWLALSAIDIALWDIKGKATHRSLLDMLGGARSADLPAVTSSHPHGPEIGKMVADAARTVVGRTQGYKFGMTPGGDQQLGTDHARDVGFVAGLREALGPEALIVADARAAVGWDVDTAARRAQDFERYALTWLEEPLAPWDRDGYRALKARTRLRLGYGEREWTVADYDRVLEDGLSDVLGVDHGRVGGVTASWLIAQRIAAADRKLNSHSWSGVILSAVGLTVSCASGAALMFEVKPIPDPMQAELVAAPLLPVGGRLAPPTGPGIGVEILEDVVARFRSDR